MSRSTTTTKLDKPKQDVISKIEDPEIYSIYRELLGYEGIKRSVEEFDALFTPIEARCFASGINPLGCPKEIDYRFSPFWAGLNQAERQEIYDTGFRKTPLCSITRDKKLVDEIFKHRARLR